MRLALSSVLMLALPLLSGCAELVDDPQDLADVGPQVAAAADGVAEAVQTLPGHVAGTVVDATGILLAGATVRLPALNLTRTTNDDGSFAFVDLTPGPYDLEASHPGWLAARTSVIVPPGGFARPQLLLPSLPPPQPYSEVLRFDGYSDLLLGPFGYALDCDCSFEVAFADGLQEVVLEAVLLEDGGPFGSQSLQWWMSTYDNATDSGAAFQGWGDSPMAVRLPGADLGPATEAYIQVMPEGGFMPEANRAFTVYLTAFYHAPGPADYTALSK